VGDVGVHVLAQAEPEEPHGVLRIAVAEEAATRAGHHRERVGLVQSPVGDLIDADQVRIGPLKPRVAAAPT